MSIFIPLKLTIWKVSTADGNISPEESELSFLVEISYCLFLFRAGELMKWFRSFWVRSLADAAVVAYCMPLTPWIISSAE